MAGPIRSWETSRDLAEMLLRAATALSRGHRHRLWRERGRESRDDIQARGRAAAEPPLPRHRRCRGGPRRRIAAPAVSAGRCRAHRHPPPAPAISIPGTAWRRDSRLQRLRTGRKLHARKVPGVGDRSANLLMIVGEGPGHDEDIRGEPFVGRAGQLLDRMLAAIGIEREQVFITNIVKCRPPNNRDPKPRRSAALRARFLRGADRN